MRLEGRSKAGFYPTPHSMTDKIASYLKVETPTKCRLLDPCCGTAEALEHIARKFDIQESYGVELDRERANLSKEKLTKVISGSYSNLLTPEKAYSLLFLNPPYDTDSEFKRLEYQFLLETTCYLATNGIIVYIIPHQHLTPKTARYFSYWYKDIQVLRFSDEEYEAFNQIVIFGVKKEKYTHDKSAEDKLNKIARLSKDAFPVIQESIPQYTLPSVNNKNFWFRSRYLDPAECCEEIEKFGLWNDAEIKNLLFPKSENTLKPLMPLRRGHIAMLIGAGMMDNLEVRKGRRRLLIKGKTEKKSHRTEEETDDGVTIKETDYVVTTVNVLDLHKGEIQTIK